MRNGAPVRRRAHSASTRAGVCLCHGVPATQSRSSLRVSSFGATPVATRRAARIREVEAEPVRQRDVAGLHALRDLDRRPRRCRGGSRAARGRRPQHRCRFASSGFMRSAPPRSFFRHSGLRMIVLAVNERRSPAESTNGNSGLAPGSGSVARESSSSKSSGIGELDPAVRRAEALEALSRRALASYGATNARAGRGASSRTGGQASSGSGSSPMRVLPR